MPDPTWRPDIDSLSFLPRRHDACCVVHRRAFQTLLGLDPTPQQCEAWYLENEAAFHRAAEAKVARELLSPGTTLHLTSRDITRAMFV